MARDFEEIEVLQKEFKSLESKFNRKIYSTEEISSFIKRLLTPRLFLIKL